eukprot:4614786-Ditylum_brightwellii.AAC.1
MALLKNFEQQEDTALGPKQDPSAQECVGQSGNKTSLVTPDADKTRSARYVSTTVACNSTHKQSTAIKIILCQLCSLFK